jgi:hypothetical protein
MRTLPERLAKVGDLWAPVLGPGIDLAKCVAHLERVQRGPGQSFAPASQGVCDDQGRIRRAEGGLRDAEGRPRRLGTGRPCSRSRKREFDRTFEGSESRLWVGLSSAGLAGFLIILTGKPSKVYRRSEPHREGLRRVPSGFTARLHHSPSSDTRELSRRILPGTFARIPCPTLTLRLPCPAEPAASSLGLIADKCLAVAA